MIGLWPIGMLASGAGGRQPNALCGRLEIKVDRDLSSIDRVRLVRAIVDLFDGLS